MFLDRDEGKGWILTPWTDALQRQYLVHPSDKDSIFCIHPTASNLCRQQIRKNNKETKQS
jgi:hypothetical protein